MKLKELEAALKETRKKIDEQLSMVGKSLQSIDPTLYEKEEVLEGAIAIASWRVEFDTIAEPEENDNEVVFLYGWGQSCLDAKGMFPVSSVDEIDPSKHWVDKAKLSEDKEAYWLELVEQYGERR